MQCRTVVWNYILQIQLQYTRSKHFIVSICWWIIFSCIVLMFCAFDGDAIALMFFIITICVDNKVEVKKKC